MANRCIANIREELTISYYYEALLRILKEPYELEHNTILPASQVRIYFFEETLLTFYRFIKLNNGFLTYFLDDKVRCLKLTELLFFYLNESLYKVKNSCYFVYLIIL